MFADVDKIDHGTIWINFWMLFSTSLIPLATGVISESFYDTQSHVLYGAVMTTTTLLYAILEERAIRLSKKRSGNKARRMNWTAVIIFLSSIPLSFVSVYISAFIFVALPALYFILPRKFSTEEGLT